MTRSGSSTKKRSPEAEDFSDAMEAFDDRKDHKVGEIARTMASGVPLGDVADMYGLNEDDVIDAVMLYLSVGREKLTREAYAAMVDVRLDMMRQALWPRAMRGKVSAVQTILRIESLGMKLHGLDMGTKAARDQALALQMQADNQAKALAMAAARAMEDAGLQPQQRMKILAALEAAPSEGSGREYYTVDDLIEDSEEYDEVIND